MSTEQNTTEGGKAGTPEPPSRPLPCIRCGKQLEPVHADIPTQPHAGTTFIARGQYGSTVFDNGPRYSGWLEINVCDACLREVGPLAYIWLIEPPVCHHEPTRKSWKPWEPGDDPE